jgi:hypothetical protein
MRYVTSMTILFILLLSGCKKSTAPLFDYNSIKLDTFIVNNYSRDAKILYYNEIYNNPEHINRNNPILDTNEIKKILKIIQAVYDLNSKESNTIFKSNKIHTALINSFNTIELKVDPTLPEIKKMINRVRPTGNQDLDNLLNTYSLDSVKTLSYTTFSWVTLCTKKEFNMIAIMNKFNQNPSIILAEVGSFGGDGNRITLSRTINSTNIIFSIGTGDCPSGCTYHKYWDFKMIEGEPISVKIYED